ncbi:MAG: LysR substrate-binding domain-containing protein [Pseudomonadales bacterium]|nr:LysR substrate-binding domain-containing protein [Pseudomonadales bacterium]NRA16661.1 LysR family transcriptional regulator [Oceanospirillaceae bacterium]
MDLRWLEDVLILLEEGNLTRAAQRRDITQPAFSRRIRAFENWLGYEILDRNVNRVTIRDSTRNSEAEIRALILRLNDLRKKMSLADPEQKHLTITAQHSLAISMFTDFISLVNVKFEPITYSLKTENQGECVSMLIRGDADIMLCYEAPDDPKFPFDDTFLSMTWGTDHLVPVVGGSLIPMLDSDGSLPDKIPIITFPKDSFFDRVLSTSNCKNLTRDPTFQVICESAFSAGIREMALNGIGMAWLPLSLITHEIETGKLIDKSNLYGSVPLNISLYGRPENDLVESIVKNLKLLRINLVRVN